MDYQGPERRRTVLTDKDLEKISELVRLHSCPMNIDEIQTVKSIVNIAKEVGDGDLFKGANRMRDNIKFIDRIMTKKSILSGLAIVTVFGFLLQKAIWLVWDVIRQAMR